MYYPKLPGLTPDGTIYHNMEMGTLEALLPSRGWQTAHAPSLLELPNSDLLCCWFAGDIRRQRGCPHRLFPTPPGGSCLAAAGGYFQRPHPQ